MREQFLQEVSQIERELDDKIEILETDEGVNKREVRLRRYKTAKECVEHYRTLINKLDLPRENSLFHMYENMIYSIREYFNI